MRIFHRRQDDERGVVLVEAAIITMFLLTITFGIIEFGLLFKDTLSASSSVRSGARVASALPRQTSMRDAAKRAVDTSVKSGATPTKLWVYKADTDGYPIGGDDTWTSGCPSSTCSEFLYGPNGEGGAWVNSGWPAATQMACGGEDNTDSVGIYLQSRHTFLTGFFRPIFGEEKLINEHTVMRLEPITTGTCQ